MEQSQAWDLIMTTYSIGVIQVDTEHVHCHLAMVDRGEGLACDGYKRKINETKKSTQTRDWTELDRDKTLRIYEQ